MRISALFLTFSIIASSHASSAEVPIRQSSSASSVPSKPASSSFTPFTGKILKNKVRIRLQPSLESVILREIHANDLVIVLGENEEFFAIEAPSDLKAYVYRTFVLDGVVEGNHVNVRLEPDTNAPVIAQLNSGDIVRGTVSAADKKWLEIIPPTTTRFYISKEYVKNIGSPALLATLQKQRVELQAILQRLTQDIEIELNKPLNQMQLENIVLNLNKMINNTNFPDEAAKAKTLLSKIQETYLKKQIAEGNTAYGKTMLSSVPGPTALPEPPPIDGETGPRVVIPPTVTAMTPKMAAWLPVEQKIFEAWTGQGGQPSMEAFYSAQKHRAATLKGTIESYNRLVRNKPGDYLLLDPNTHQPIAYLYSTKVNLHDRVGQEVSIEVTPRENHNFAFPAYFVLSIE